MQGTGRILIFSGLVLICLGSVIMLAQKIPFLGRLPGDICIKKEHFTFYFPLGTCLLLSLAVSFLLWLFSRK